LRHGVWRASVVAREGNVMDGAAREFREGLKACFESLHDPRVRGRCEHRLLDIIAITILAVLCGAEDWTDIEEFGQTRADWLQSFLELPGGIPSHDTFQRVFGLLDRSQFAAGLFQWTQALHKATGGKLIAIDGKALRRSFAKKSGKAMLHLVTAWASENGLTLGQVAVEDKSNEITAIPELLKLLNLKGSTVTIDAMGTQKEIAAQIREQKGHYMLALKGNQSGLKDDMQALFDHGVATGFAGMKHDVYESAESGHGRTDERTCHVIDIPQNHPQRAAWKDLRTLAVTVSRRVVNDQESWESRMYVSSHPPRAKMLATVIRRHWAIENSQHWVLDVTFGEDARRQQNRNGAANLAAVRRLAVSLLRQDSTVKRGAKCKRMKCALDHRYLLHVLDNAKFDA
jgi:predicted transposase YbfD/YdcC